MSLYRDAGGADYGFREAAESGLYPGPRMLVSGRPLSQTGGHADKRRRSEWIEPVDCCVGMAGMIADGADEVRKAARDLALNLSSHGYGMVSFAARDLQLQINTMIKLLDNKEVRNAYGARDMWQVIDQVAALAAGRQNRLWEYIELFYRQQGAEGSGYVTPDFLTSIARQTPGLDLAAWSSARAQPALRSVLSADSAAATKVGANATPTLVLRGPRGTKQLSGAPSYGTLSQAIASVAG